MNKHSKKLLQPISDPINSTANLKEKNHITDSALWHQFQTGDESAFIEIYKQYGNQLYNYGCQFSGDKELVKDCLQDFFIYLRKNRGKFSATDSIKFYLMKSFKRIILRNLIKKSKTLRLNKTFAFSQFPVELSSETVLINQQIEDSQIKKLNEALSGLKGREREAIYYFYYEGFSYEQIAKFFGFSHVSSGRRLIYTALVRLRKFFPLMILPGVVSSLHP